MSFEVYIHVPWCQHKCPYCNFNVYVEKDPPFVQWMEQILWDWKWHQNQFDGTPRSIYFGGGTPSLMPPKYLTKIINTIAMSNTISNTISNTMEITIEVNPENATAELLQQYKDMGINRISLGVQTFQPQTAKILGRSSSVKQNRRAISLVQEKEFSSWSFDLIFGVANQTMDELLADLKEIAHIKPPHVSLYGLTYKENTALYQALKRGQIQEISEDLWTRMFDTITQTLFDLGYERYEVSNFSLPGHRAKHNEAIWKNGYYAGLGPGAHGFLPTGIRTEQPSIWSQWLQKKGPHLDLPTPEQQVWDILLTSIRHCDGIDLRNLKRLGYAIEKPNSQSQNCDWVNDWLHWSENQIQLRNMGWIMVDWITQQLIDRLYTIPISI